MSAGIEAVTTAALGLALDAASLRQQAIAANIANSETQGYVPVRVSFEDQLEGARRELQEQGTLDAASLSGVEPRLQRVAPNGLGYAGQMRPDIEVAHLAQNAVQYQVLIKGLSRHFAILSEAVGDGKK